MVTNVHQDDPVERIEDFIFNQLIDNDLPPCHIIKINKASFLGNLARIEHRLLELKKILSIVEENLERLVAGSKEHEALQKKIIALNSEKAQMKSKLQRYMTLLRYNREQILSSSLAFVTVSTKHEKRALIHIRSRKSTPYIYTIEFFKAVKLLLKRCLGMKFS